MRNTRRRNPISTEWRRPPDTRVLGVKGKTIGARLAPPRGRGRDSGAVLHLLRHRIGAGVLPLRVERQPDLVGRNGAVRAVLGDHAGDRAMRLSPRPYPPRGP